MVNYLELKKNAKYKKRSQIGNKASKNTAFRKIRKQLTFKIDICKCLETHKKLIEAMQILNSLHIKLKFSCIPLHDIFIKLVEAK